MNTKHICPALPLPVAMAVAAPAAAQSSRSWEDQVAATVEAQVRASLRSLHQLDELDRTRAIEALNALDFSGLESLRSLRALKGLDSAAALAVIAQDQKAAGRETERITKTFKVGANGSLDVQNMSGDITVKAGTGDDLVVDATKRARARADLAAVRVDIVERSGRVEVRSVYSGRNARVAVDYVVTMPANGSATLHTMSGDIVVSGIKGTLRLDAMSGDIRVTDPRQLQNVSTASGDVVITGGESGDVRVDVLSGSITVRGTRVRALDATSVSGEVILNDVESGRVNVSTMAGDVTYSGPLAAQGRYAFKTHSGDVHLTLPGNTGFELNANTFNGDVRSDVALTTTSSVSARPSDKGRTHRSLGRAVKGTFGDGSAMLTVTTFSGDVTLTKK